MASDLIMWTSTVPAGAPTMTAKQWRVRGASRRRPSSTASRTYVAKESSVAPGMYVCWYRVFRHLCNNGILWMYRAAVGRAPSLCGRQETGADRGITATATATQTASTPSPSAVPHSRACLPGTLRSAPPPWPQPTAAEITPTRESYDTLFTPSINLPPFSSQPLQLIIYADDPLNCVLPENADSCRLHACPRCSSPVRSRSLSCRPVLTCTMSALKRTPGRLLLPHWLLGFSPWRWSRSE